MNFDKIIAVRTGKTVYKDGGRTVKVFDGDYSKSDILNEALNQARAEEAGLNVPSLISVDGESGRWSITSSYINGKTAARIITETPERTALALEAFVNAQLLFQSYKLPLLTALKSKAARRIAAAEISDKKRKELSELLDSSVERLVALGEELTEVRKKAAAAFEKQVCDILSYLNMPDVRFTVQFAKGRYTKRGCDTAEFMISANRGESVKPLSKIASGGELSRVMLAIKSVLLGKDPVGTMIFDEIDTGISGYTAGKVGTQLKRVAENRQVICVTHLAQIAAMGDTHLLIEKKAEGDRTFTSVSPLSYEDRINEIARIMSGAQMTENLYNSAKELLDRSKQS